MGDSLIKCQYMNLFFFVLIFGLIIAMLVGCNSKTDVQHKTLKVHDTLTVLPEGEFTYNLPCKVVNINQEKEGKSMLFIWLHGGVKDRLSHEQFLHLHHACADDSVLKYLYEKGKKAIVLFPLCHKAENVNCVSWKECYYDVKHMINDYVNKGIVDSSRIYLAGASDGGNGTWDYLEMDKKTFAAAMPMSCNNPRKSSIPVYFFNTRSENDCTSEVNKLNQQGCFIKYKHCPQYKHGGDGAECTMEFLDAFFSNVKK